MKNLLLMRAPLKYIQGANALKHFYENIKEFGNNYLFICSNSAYKSTHDLIEGSFKDSKTKRIYQIFSGISSVGEINKMREIVRNEKIDVVVGVGGGSAIDTSKATAYYEKKRIAIIPTVCATDAPCTGLSVIYNDDHTFNSYLFYPNNPDFVLVDSLVIANAPTKFLVAGMGDALGTYFEARECYKTSSLSLIFEIDIGFSLLKFQTIKNSPGFGVPYFSISQSKTNVLIEGVSSIISLILTICGTSFIKITTPHELMLPFHQ